MMVYCLIEIVDDGLLLDRGLMMMVYCLIEIDDDGLLLDKD